VIAQGGTSTFSSYQPGGIDTINLANGNVSLNIPLFSYPQLGNKLQFGFSLVYNIPGWFFDADPPVHDSAALLQTSGHGGRRSRSCPGPAVKQVGVRVFRR
jgi:hypothetical protein